MAVKLNICLVSDFFCPNTGGVETHIYYLAQCLIARGHRVVVITHAYPDRRGLRLLSNDLKVYYLPFLVFYNGVVLPTVFTTLPWIRLILLREQIHIVHGHSSFSTLGHEALLHAAGLGLATVFTDHSLFGFADASAILTNKLLQWSLSHCDHVVCVSHTSKENTVLRARLAPEKVSVIPNAVQCQNFVPDIRQYRDNPVTVVIISRLVYRKGTDLLASIIPEICARFPDVRFVIGGDGPKRVLLEEVRERRGLQERVRLLGTVPHSQVRDILVQGQIFLNTSLTEAFCMAIVEAASCGRSSFEDARGDDEGGRDPRGPPARPHDARRRQLRRYVRLALIPERLRPIPDLTLALDGAIRQLKTVRAAGRLADPMRIHERVTAMYHWPDVAERVERVYVSILRDPVPSMHDKLPRYFRCGLGFGWFFTLVALTNLLYTRVLGCMFPLPSPPRPQLDGETRRE